MKKRLMVCIFIGALTLACLSGCNKQSQGTDASREDIDIPVYPKDLTLEQAVDAYAAYSLPDTVSTYHLAYIDDDDIPECIFGGEKGVNGLLTLHDGALLECWTEDFADKILYDEKSRYICFYSGVRNKNLLTDVFDYYKLEEDGTFKNVGYASYRTGEKITTRYDTYPRRDTTEEIYEEYKSQFGDMASSIDGYEEMYKSVEEAYEAFQAQ